MYTSKARVNALQLYRARLTRRPRVRFILLQARSLTHMIPSAASQALNRYTRQSRQGGLCPSPLLRQRLLLGARPALTLLDKNPSGERE